MSYNDKVGDILKFEATGRFAPYIEAEVVEVNEEGRATKVKAVVPDEKLGSIGWFQEGDDWVTFDFDIISVN